MMPTREIKVDRSSTITGLEEGIVPHQLTYEPNGLGVVVTFSGFVKGEEIHTLNKQLVADPTFSQWRYSYNTVDCIFRVYEEI